MKNILIPACILGRSDCITWVEGRWLERFLSPLDRRYSMYSVPPCIKSLSWHSMYNIFIPSQLVLFYKYPSWNIGNRFDTSDFVFIFTPMQVFWCVVGPIALAKCSLSIVDTFKCFMTWSPSIHTQIDCYKIYVRNFEETDQSYDMVGTHTTWWYGATYFP